MNRGKPLQPKEHSHTLFNQLFSYSLSAIHVSSHCTGWNSLFHSLSTYLISLNHFPNPYIHLKSCSQPGIIILTPFTHKKLFLSIFACTISHRFYMISLVVDSSVQSIVQNHFKYPWITFPIPTLPFHIDHTCSSPISHFSPNPTLFLAPSFTLNQGCSSNAICIKYFTQPNRIHEYVNWIGYY